MKDSSQIEKLFVSYDQEKWSEADTRSKFIDYVLKEVCQIPESLIRREFHKGKVGYLDYLILADPFKVVVEAKRSTVDLIKGAIKSGVYKLGTLFATNPKLREHATQAAMYGAANGAPVVVLTNGRTWVMFEPYRKATDFDDLQAIVYADLVGKDKVYSPAWLAKILSVDGIQRSAYAEELGLVKTIPALPPIVSELDNGAVEHREIEIELLPSIQKYFRDAGTEMSHELLRESWVNPALPALRDANRGVKYTPRSAAELLDTRKGVEGFRELLDQINESDEDSTKVVPLIGEPGTGKTHFIRLTMLQDDTSVVLDEGFAAGAHASLEGDRLWIYADLRLLEKVPEGEVESRIFDELMTLLHKLDGIQFNGKELHVSAKETVRSMFPATFAKFSEPVWKRIELEQPLEFALNLDAAFESCKSNRAKYVRALLRHITERHKIGVRLVLDNADQLGSESQKTIYLFAEAVSYKSRSAVIVVLRESWYSHHKSGGASSAFSDFVYALAPVPVVDVLAKRLELVERDASRRLGAGSLPVYYVASLRKAIQDDEEVYELFEGLSNQSCRRGLNLIAKTTRSAALNVQDLWYAMEEGKGKLFNFRFHQIIGPLIRGRHRFYDESEYPIFNVFSATLGAGVDHWIKLRVLRTLQKQYVLRGHQRGKGFVTRSTLSRALVLVSRYSLRRVEEFLVRMCKEGLVEFDVAPVDEDDPLLEWSKVRITTMGLYAISLSGRVAYLFYMMALTPTNSPHAFREALRTLLASHEESVPVKARIEQCMKFMDYLEKDAESIEEPPSSADVELGIPSCKEVLVDLKARIDADITRVVASAGRDTSSRLTRVRREDFKPAAHAGPEVEDDE